VALQKQELWRQLRDAEAVLPRRRWLHRRRLWLIRGTASAPAPVNWAPDSTTSR